MEYVICADIHGNIKRLKAIIKHSRLDEGKQLVHLGDVADIYPFSELCLELLDKHNAIQLVGNHEVAHVLKVKIHPYNDTLDVGPFNGILRKKILSGEFPFAIEIDGYTLSHAGISKDLYNEYYPKYGDSFLSKLNNDMLEAFRGGDAYSRLLYNDRFSPIWFRPYYKSEEVAPIPQIFGHTPRSYLSKDKIHEMESNKHYSVDGYNKDGSYLYALLKDGVVTMINFHERDL